jgi:hypothetical protein
VKRSSLTNRFLNQFLSAIVLLSASIALAGTERYDYKEALPPPPQAWCVTPPDTEFRVGLPGWLTGLSGDFGVAGLVTDQDVKFTDILKRLDMIAAGSLYARYHRWEIFADGQYMKLSDTAPLRGILFESARISLKSAFAEGFIGYRLINCERASLSLYAGARYSYMSGDLHLRGVLLRSRRASGSIDWVDPVIGLGGRVRIWKPVSLWANVDGGGFDANSDSAFELTRRGRVPISSEDWSYQIQGGLEFQVTRWLWTQLGWRYLKYDYVSFGFTNKTELNGPFVQGGVNF